MKAYELLEKPGAWCQGTDAMTAKGHVVAPDSPEACSWCALGALERCYGWRSKETSAACGRVRRRLGVGSISGWNDAPGRTQEEVVALLKELDL